MVTLAEIGERALVRRLLAIYGEAEERGLGDDAAFLPVGERYLLLATDSINARTHIPPGVSGDQVGWYAAAVNLSDIAAMGGKPFGLLVSLILPPQLEVAYVEAMVRGLRACAENYDVAILGGDTKEGAEISVCITAAGWSQGSRILRRKGARPGEVLAVTGVLGWAGWGLSRLKAGVEESQAMDAVMRPQPRVEEGLHLAASRGVSSCIDSSDGLAASLGQLSEASGVAFRVDYEQLPQAPPLSELDVETRKETLLFQGGDFELLFTCQLDQWAAVRESLSELGTRATAIGEVLEARDNLLQVGGQEEVLDARGYEHFR
ncbi:MAG: thiamine-phosphate kinase [Thermoplasmata archaeon]